jgi:hypothetical protein
MLIEERTPVTALPAWQAVRRAELAACHTEPAEPDPLPAPECRAVDVDLLDERVPKAARGFAKEAIRLGWVARASYARGPRPGGREGMFKIVDSVLITCTRKGASVRVQWLDGKTDQCGHTIDGLGTIIKITEGKRLLISGGVTPDA